MNLDLHIDRLVVDGIRLRPADVPAMKQAIEAELGRLLQQPGSTPTASTSIASLALPGATLRPGAPARAVGSQVARSIYGGVFQGGRS